LAQNRPHVLEAAGRADGRRAAAAVQFVGPARIGGIVFVHWIHPHDRCPSCAYDLDAHARAAALAEAVKGRDARELPPPLVFFWTGSLTTCPRCGATLPSDAPVRLMARS